MHPTDEEHEIRVPWQSSITEVRANALLTYGVDQQTIIREFSFEETVFLLLRQRRPDEVERTMLRALLVSFASHGITGQSTLAVMAAADCPSDFLHALIGGFSVGAGPVHQGAMGATMVELQNLAVLDDSELVRYLDDGLATGKSFTGFGHRFHEQDPRARTLLDLADEVHFGGRYLAVARRMEEILRDRKGISMNISGAGAGILLDLEIDPRIAHLFVVLGRSAMFAAVYLERLAQDRAEFQRIEVLDVLAGG